MLIIGCDFHTRYQQIAVAEDSTGELLVERRLDHEGSEAAAFYRGRVGNSSLPLILPKPFTPPWQPFNPQFHPFPA